MLIIILSMEEGTDSSLAKVMQELAVMQEQRGSAYVRTVLIDLLKAFDVTDPTGSSGSSSSSRRFADVYTVGKQIGSGAFSVVCKGTNKETGDEVAIKVMTKSKLSNDDFEGLEIETALLRELDHPHIIRCYDTFDEEAKFYIVTELVGGGDLFDRIIRKSSYTEKEARDLIVMFLETMVYMHEEKGVVHRDLKPENILLTSEADDAKIKIADFGFAKKVVDLLPTESPCGTPGYVAPEVIRGERYGCEVDIWSMGVIAYVLLAGYPPFYEDPASPTYPHKLYHAIRTGKYSFHPERWGDASPEAIDMIKKMLCVSQKERWTASELLKVRKRLSGLFYYCS